MSDSSGVFLQKMKWTFSEAPLHTTTLIRNRRYIGNDSYTYQGAQKEAVVFSVREVIDDFNRCVSGVGVGVGRRGFGSREIVSLFMG